MLAGWRKRLFLGVGRNTASGRQDGHRERLSDYDQGQARRRDQLVLGESGHPMEWGTLCSPRPRRRCGDNTATKRSFTKRLAGVQHRSIVTGVGINSTV